MDQDMVKFLNYQLKTYEGLNKLIVQTKNRLAALNQDMDPKHNDFLNGSVSGRTKKIGVEQIKERLSREIEKGLATFDIWTDWLDRVPGIGPYTGGSLILLYYYAFMPECPKCGGVEIEKDKGLTCNTCGHQIKDGCLSHKLVAREFRTVSSWWSFLGLHTVDGVKPKRQKGKPANWSARGRQISWQIGEGFVKCGADHPYRQLYDQRKARHQRKNPDWTKGHCHNAAKNEAVKIFQSHFWHVARSLAGLSTEGPYAQDVLKHNHIIPPYFWEPSSS